MFVPVLVDGDTEKEVVQQFGISGYPNIVFQTAKGKKLGSVRGYLPKGQFMGQVEGALKSAGPIRPTKAYAKLLKASSKLEKAMKKEKYRDALKAIEKIEKLNHEGPDLERARAQRASIEEIGTARLANARALAEEDVEKAKKALKKIAKEFKGLDLADEAKELAKSLDQGESEEL